MVPTIPDAVGLVGERSHALTRRARSIWYLSGPFRIQNRPLKG